MFQTFIDQQRNERTRKAYGSDLRRWETFLAGREATEELAIAWRDSLVEEVKATSAVRIFGTARLYYKWAGGYNPFARVKAPRKITNWTPVVPEEADVDDTIGACTSPRDRAIISLLNNGLRAQEVVNLNVAEFYYLTQYDAWFLKLLGKGDKERIIPATDETITALHNYAMPRIGPMFPGLNIRKVYYAVKKWSRKAGIGDIHPHSFRHAYATRLYRNEVDVLTLQRLLGHARPDTTATYAHLDLGMLVAANSKDPRNKRGARRLKAVV